MAITDRIGSMTRHLESAWQSIENKGGNIPSEKNMANLSDGIDSISAGSGGWAVPEFDGGEWGVVAYLKDGEIEYYAATSATDLYFSSDPNEQIYIVKTLSDGHEILNNDIVGFSLGNKVSETPNGLLMNCFRLQSVYFPTNGALTTIGNNFLRLCGTFNSDVTIPEGVTSIKDGFLYASRVFNAKVSLPSTLESIGDYFLHLCKTFNQDITIPDKVSSIGSYFLTGDTRFNGELTLSAGLKTIGDQFLKDCVVFNHEFTLACESIGNSFMRGCLRFSQPLTLPDTLTHIGGSFMYNCDDFTGELNVGKSSGFTVDDTTLATDNESALMYAEGVLVSGDTVANWLGSFGKRDTKPFRNVHKGSAQSEFEALKQALDAGTAQTYYPIGTELADVENGVVNPLIVVQYLDSSNNSAYGGVEGVILQRKFVSNEMVWDADSASDYATSDVNTFLNGSYLSQCSAELLAMISELSVPTYTPSGLTQPKCVWFLPSVVEMYGNPSTTEGTSLEGVGFSYWSKVNSGRPTNDVTTLRAIKTTANRTAYWWTRTNALASNNLSVYFGTPSGNLSYGGIRNPQYVLACCFIAKS